MSYYVVFNWYYILSFTIAFNKSGGRNKWHGKFAFEFKELLKSVSHLALQRQTIFLFANILLHNQTFCAFEGPSK